MAPDFYSNQTSATPYSPKSLGPRAAKRTTIVAVVNLAGQVDEDDMFLVHVPAGTVIFGSSSAVHSDGAFGATGSINVGTPTSSSALATAVDVATAGTYALDAGPYTTTVAEYITADIEAIGTPADAVLTFYLDVLFPSS